MRVVPAALIALVLALVGAGAWALVTGRFSDDSSPGEPAARQSPGAETPTPTAAADGSPTAPAEAEPTLVYTEFGRDQDTIWLAAVSRLEERQAVATVAHAAFWGINASLAPDGASVAYTALSPTVPNPEEAADNQAELWVQPLAGGEGRLLANNADVRVAPMWAPDSGSLVYQSVARESNSPTLFRVNMEDGSASVLATLSGAAAAFPVGFSSDAQSFYVAQIGEGGTDLLAISTADGSVRTLARIAGGVARDWHASADGSSLAFVNRVQGRWELGVASLPDGSLSALESDLLPPVELFSPVWHPRRSIVTVGTAPSGGATGALNVPLNGDGGERLPGPDQGFDVPLAWSPDGGYLTVQGYSEYPVQQRGRLFVITPDGQRIAPAGQAEVTFVGWLGGDA